MRQAIRTICLALPFRMGSVNCYLLETGSGFVLIDTGGSNQRKALEENGRPAASRGSQTI
jgi:glyoxylase-like metal-dependent hydrolase (beta-lactamase superfamily II)